MARLAAGGQRSFLFWVLLMTERGGLGSGRVRGVKRSCGIVWDAQRVNNYNVQIVWCMSPATFALLLLIRNAQRALRRIKNKSHSKHRHARTHAKAHTRTHTEPQLTTMTPSINSGRVDVCYAGLHCEKRTIEYTATKLGERIIDELRISNSSLLN